MVSAYIPKHILPPRPAFVHPALKYILYFIYLNVVYYASVKRLFVDVVVSRKWHNGCGAGRRIGDVPW